MDGSKRRYVRQKERNQRKLSTGQETGLQERPSSGSRESYQDTEEEIDFRLDYLHLGKHVDDPVRLLAISVMLQAIRDEVWDFFLDPDSGSFKEWADLSQIPERVWIDQVEARGAELGHPDNICVQLWTEDEALEE